MRRYVRVIDQAASHTVGDVAGLTGVTVRTLHHYDEIGLLAPDERTAAGYRIYGEADLDRLHRILSYRALGLSLEDIAAILDDPGTDALGHLRRQRELLEGQIGRLEAIVKAIEHEMEARKMGIQLTPEERFEVFGDFDPDAHAEEAESRWGGTDAFAESQRRVGGYTKADWQRLQAEVAEIEQRLASAMADGIAPDAPRAAELAEAHRQHLNRWFYECSPQMHQGLTQMYVDDPRFTARYEEIASGLAGYIRDAAAATAQRSSGV